MLAAPTPAVPFLAYCVTDASVLPAESNMALPFQYTYARNATIEAVKKGAASGKYQIDIYMSIHYSKGY
jgi:hypothetical protein